MAFGDLLDLGLYVRHGEVVGGGVGDPGRAVRLHSVVEGSGRAQGAGSKDGALVVVEDEEGNLALSVKGIRVVIYFIYGVTTV